MTPHELRLATEAHADHVHHSREQSVTQAYLTAIWARWVRRPPKLRQVLDHLRPNKPGTAKMSPEEWLKILEQKEREK